MRDWIILDCAPLAAKHAIARELADELVKDTAHGLGVSVSALMQPNRRRAIAWARQRIMLTLRERGWSLLRIARYFDMNHTTVMYGVKAAQARTEAARARRLTHMPAKAPVDELSHVKHERAA